MKNRSIEVVVFAVTLSTLTLLAPARADAAPGAFDLSAPTNGAWCTATCKFTWQAASAAASYQLYVDSVLKKDAIAPTSPPAYTLAAGEALAEGWHTWYVVAKDSGGVTTQSTSTFSVRVDATPPAAFSLLTPANNAFVPSSPVTVTWSASSDGGSGLDHYEIWVNGSAVSAAIPPSATSGPAALPTATLFSDPINAGCPSWTLGSDWHCYKYYDDPMLAFGDGCCEYNRSGHVDLNSSFDLSNVGQATLHFSYMGDVGSSANYRARFSDDGGSTWSEVLTIPLGSGSYSSWTTASATLPMAGTATATLGFIANDGTWNDGWSVDDVSVSGIVAQTYTWNVVAVDVAGNRTVSDTWQVRYDLPPVPFNLSAPADGTWTASTKPTLSWNATTDAGSGVAKYQLWVDGTLSTDNLAAAATSATPASALTDGTHAWQIYAVDAAGGVRQSRQTWKVGIDTTPPQAFSLLSPPDQSGSGVPTPTLCWSKASDAGSGVDHYQLFVDGTLSRDGIADPSSGQVCTTPNSVLAEGAHTWSAKAVDKVGNVQTSTETWTVYADFSPPGGFSLLTPANGSTVDTLTPTFTWGASSDTGGLSHYELRIDSTCVACSIPATSTTYTLTTPLTAASHSWSVAAVDHAANSTTATGAPWTFTARQCAPTSTGACVGNSTGACNPGTRTCSADGTWGSCAGVVTPVAENCGNGIDDDCDGLVDCADPDCASACAVGPEPGPGPEPPRDAGVDVFPDAGPDGPATTSVTTSTATTTTISTSTAITSTVTATATGTATGATATSTAATATVTASATAATGTGTITLTTSAGATSTVVTPSATGTGTATATSVGPGPGQDAASPVIADGAAPGTPQDAGLLSAPDATALRDGLAADARGASQDAPLGASDAAGAGFSDGGSGLAEAGAAGKPDASSTRQEGGRPADGAPAGDAASGKSGTSGGCGCVLGGASTDRSPLWLVLGLAVFVLWPRRSRQRSRRL
jgi:MYXO-CTERM domain-containing protein